MQRSLMNSQKIIDSLHKSKYECFTAQLHTNDILKYLRLIIDMGIISEQGPGFLADIDKFLDVATSKVAAAAPKVWSNVDGTSVYRSSGKPVPIKNMAIDTSEVERNKQIDIENEKRAREKQIEDQNKLIEREKQLAAVIRDKALADRTAREKQIALEKEQGDILATLELEKNRLERLQLVAEQKNLEREIANDNTTEILEKRQKSLKEQEVEIEKQSLNLQTEQMRLRNAQLHDDAKRALESHENDAAARRNQEADERAKKALEKTQNDLIEQKRALELEKIAHDVQKEKDRVRHANREDALAIQAVRDQAKRLHDEERALNIERKNAQRQAAQLSHADQDPYYAHGLSGGRPKIFDHGIWHYDALRIIVGSEQTIDVPEAYRVRDSCEPADFEDLTETHI